MRHVILLTLLLAACRDDTTAAADDTAPEADADTDTDSDSDSDTDTDTDTDSDTDTDVEPDACAPLPPPSGATVSAGPGDDLFAVVRDLEAGQTLLLEDGTYALDGTYMWVSVPGVTIRSASGDREAVVLDGGYVTTSIINVQASDVTVADLTIQRAYNHPIHVMGSSEGHVERVRIHNVHIIDPGEQAIKINGNSGGYTDDGEVGCSRIELTDAGRPHIRNNCYTGGIDAHGAYGWWFHDNDIEGFWCESGLSEHGIHLWRSCRDSVVERNRIANSARGIGIGLSNSPGSNDRSYDDDPCPSEHYVGDYGALVRNNTVFADSSALFASASGFDAGVALEAACDAVVVHNTVFSTEAPFSSIEWRFEGTSAEVYNNLVSHNLRARTEGIAVTDANIEGAAATVFADALAGDLRLAEGSAAQDAGRALDEGVCPEDIDGLPRDEAPDPGAHELP